MSRTDHDSSLSSEEAVSASKELLMKSILLLSSEISCIELSTAYESGLHIFL